MPSEVPFFWSQRWALLAKVPVFGPQKMAPSDHVQPQWSCFTKCLLTFWASVSFHSTVGEQWACAFSDVQLDQMTCCIGHKRMVFLCCGLACASPDVLLDQMSYCKLNKCVSFFSVGEHVRFHMLSFTKWLIASTQAWAFSLLRITMWSFRAPAQPKNFWHSKHLCIL